MASVAVKPNHLKYGGKQYFRGGAEDVLLGSYGEIKKSPLWMNYLEVQGTVPASKLEIRNATECDIDFANSVEFSVSHSGVAEGTIDGVPVKASVDGAGSGEFGSEGRLRLVKLIVEAGDMESVLESDDLSGVLKKLKRYGGDDIKPGDDARVCHEIFVVMEASLAHSLAVSGELSLSGSADVDGIEVTGKEKLTGGHTRTTKVKISERAIQKKREETEAAVEALRRRGFQFVPNAGDLRRQDRGLSGTTESPVRIH